MKKYCFIGLLTALLLNACSEKEDPTELPPVTEESITLITGTETNFNFDSEGGNVTLPFTASAGWTAKFLSPDDKEWIQVEPSTGTAGEQNVTITAQANELTEERKATLLLECGKKSIKVDFTQNEIMMIDLGDNLYLHPNGRALEYRMDQLAEPDNETLSKISNHIYEHFKDEFDFIFFICNAASAEEIHATVAGYSMCVKTNIKGIGQESYDNSASFGSEGRLKSLNVITNYQGMYSSGPILHEIFHYWGAMDIGQEHVDEEGNRLEDSVHWGMSSVNGSVGGFRLDLLTRNWDGDPKKYRAGCDISVSYGEMYFFQHGVSSFYYADLELYLMGLIPPSEVEPIHLFKGVKIDENFYRTGIFSAEKEEIVTIDEIIDKYGPREPNWMESQKDFQGVVVVLTEKPVKGDVWKVILQDVKDQEMQGEPSQDRPNFYMATGKRATLTLSVLNKFRKP